MSLHETKVNNFKIAMSYDGHNILITDGEKKALYKINEGDIELPFEMVLNAVGASVKAYVESNYTE